MHLMTDRPPPQRRRRQLSCRSVLPQNRRLHRLLFLLDQDARTLRDSDDAVKIYPLIARCDRLLLISRIRFGCYDLPMKRLLERSLPIQQPFLQLRRGNPPRPRDVCPKDAVLIAYGESSPEERQLFSRLVERNALNLCFASSRVLFVDEENLDGAVAREVSRWEE